MTKVTSQHRHGRARCVVFDVDDTLYLERDYVRSGFDAVGLYVARELGFDDFGERAWARFEQGARGRIFDAVLESLAVPDSPPQLIADLIARYRSHTPTISLLPDAADCLGRLSGRVELCVVTGGPPASQKAKVASLGIEKWVREVVFSGGLGPGLDKPHPRAFELLEARTPYRSSEYVYVADNPAKDFVGPTSLGWRSVRIRRSGSLHADVRTPVSIPEVIDLTRLEATIGLAC